MSGSAVSGSENWETYTDNSETEEADATEAYYAKVKAQQSRQYPYQHQQQSVKRPGTAQGGIVKRVREQEVIVEVEGSEGGWTDDGDVGETY